MTRKLLLILALILAMTAPVFAQWPRTPTKGLPRLPDGKPNLAAPAPKGADGKPDISGLWQPAPLYIGDISRDLKPGELPFQPWAEELYKHRRETQSKDDPTGWCVPGGVPRSDAVPYPFKILQTPGMVAILYEAVHSFRQIFMDGRAHPKDVNPTWYGHSVGHWEGETLVVDTVGFNDLFWFDFVGHPHTEKLHTVERYTRTDFGTLKEEVTIDDPGAYTRPFTLHASHRLVPGDEIMEYICQENQKDTQHLVGPAGRP